MTYSTAQVAALVGCYPHSAPDRLMPHQVTHPGQGRHHRWEAQDVAAALVWAALDRSQAYRQVAALLGYRLSVGPSAPWVLCWPQGWLDVRSSREVPALLRLAEGCRGRPGGAYTLLFLDHILRPLEQTPC